MTGLADIANRIEHHRRLLKKWKHLLVNTSKPKKKKSAKWKTAKHKAMKHHVRLRQCLAEQVRSEAEHSG